MKNHDDLLNRMSTPIGDTMHTSEDIQAMQALHSLGWGSRRIAKEQVVHGRVFEKVDDVRIAMEAFVKKYNKSWLVQQLGYRSPVEAKLKWKKKWWLSAKKCPHKRGQYSHIPRCHLEGLNFSLVMDYQVQLKTIEPTGCGFSSFRKAQGPCHKASKIPKNNPRAFICPG